MDRITFRAATILDLGQVASWIGTREECERWAGPKVGFPIEMEGLASTIEFAQANGFAATRDRDEVVAFGQLIRKGQRGHLARLIVSPSFRRRGYGKALVRALLERARVLSLDPVSLNVNAANHAAVRLYRELGFADATPPRDEPAVPGTRYMERSVSRKVVP